MPETAGQIQRLEEQIKGLDNIISGIKRNPYLIAQQVFGSISFFREYYASSGPFQAHLQQLIEILRGWGRNTEATSFDTGKFLIGLADLLEESNRPGPWPGLKGRDERTGGGKGPCL